MSYRGAGAASVSIDNNGISLEKTWLFDSPPTSGFGFDSLLRSFSELKNKIYKINKILNHDVIIVEMPCYTQSAKSAILIGMCWGSMIALNKHIDIIDPSVLKDWSESKKGDKKNKVKEKVLERFDLTGKDLNDNIVDAIGICLVFSDLISKQRYEATKR